MYPAGCWWSIKMNDYNDDNDGVIFNTSAHVLRFASVEVTGFSSCSSTRGWRCGKGQETGQRCERLLEHNWGIIARPNHSI
jgi:hypothetical protein